MKLKSTIQSVMALAAAGAMLPASADTFDLTAGGTTTIGGAIFTTSNNQSTGTGVISSFVRVQDNGIADGYNTSGRPMFYGDTNTSPTFTHDLLLTDVPVVTIGGVAYREFLLDINQTNANPLLSLDKLQFATSATGGATTAWGTFGTQVYTLGANELLLNYSLNNGSGSGDLFVYVPTAVFGDSAYVYLYSMFGAKGGNYAENDGFEEWAVRTPVTPAVPEPETYALMLAGLGVVGFMARRRKQV